jgi:hypothetical protein
MLEPDCVTAIAAGLTDCLHAGRDLSTAPEFQLIFQLDQERTLEFLTIDEAVWRQWNTHRRLPAQIGVEECIDVLTSTVTGWLLDWVQQPGAVLVGCSLMYNEPAGDQASAGGPSRFLVARDIDGRIYQGASHVDGGHVSVRVRDDAPTGRARAVAAALDQILDNRVVARFRLPDTGYVLLHTTQRDGGPPTDVTLFIDVAGRMDDTAATLHLWAQVAHLEQHAPSNIVHTIRLVHRTTDGDRHICTTGPIRGTAPPKA